MPPERSQIITFLKTLYPFHKLDDLMVSEIATNLRVSELAKGHRIYRQGTRAETDNLCIIFSGNIRMTRRGKTNVEEIAILGPGEIFGYEILQNNFPHPVTVEVKSDAIIFQIDRGHFRQILSKMPEMAVMLKILMDSYLLRLKAPLYWRNPDEVIHFIARRHWFFLLKKLAFPSFLSVALLPALYLFSRSFPSNSGPVVFIVFIYLFIFGIWLTWSFLDWSNDYAIITNQRVLSQEKVLLLYESRQEAPLTAVLSVATKTGQVGRIFNFGDVIVRTYAGSVFLNGLPNPQNIAAFLELQWGRTKSSRVTMEKAALEDAIRLRLGIPLKSQSLPDPTQPAAVTVAPGGIHRVQGLLADLFNLRVEKEGEVTYRMHWIILLKKILLPSLLIIATWLLFVSFLFGRVAGTPLGLAIFLTLFFTLGLGFWWLYQFIDWRDDYYVISQDQILDVYKKPLGREEKRSAPLKNVQSVNFERIGLIGLLLNYGSVVIMVGEAELTFDNVYNPSDVQRELFKRLAERDYNEKRAKLESDQKWVGDWISAYHRVIQDNQRNVLPKKD